MRDDLGTTEGEFRAHAREATDRLLAALVQEHGEEEVKPEPVKIQIIEDTERVRFLEEQIDELKSTISRQRSMIAGLCDAEELVYPRLSEVLEAVCQFYKVTRTNIVGPSRIPKYLMPRQIACYLGREMTKLSLPEIGRKLGDRDHTTILHGVNKIEKQLQADEILKDDIDVLKIKIEAKVDARRAIAKRAIA